MHVNTIYNLVVDKHYSRYYNSHPSLMERIEHIEQWKKEHGWTETKPCQDNDAMPNHVLDYDSDYINQYLTNSFHKKYQ